MNRIIVFLLIFSMPVLLKSEYSWESSPAEPILQQGIELLYN